MDLFDRATVFGLDRQVGSVKRSVSLQEFRTMMRDARSDETSIVRAYNNVSPYASADEYRMVSRHAAHAPATSISDGERYERRANGDPPRQLSDDVRMPTLG